MKDSEFAVLGACMIDPSAYWRVADLLRPEHFTTHSRMWADITQLARDGEAFDAVTLSERGHRDAVSIANTDGWRASNVRAYAQRVYDSAIAKQVSAAGKRIATLEGSGSERLAEAQRIVRDIDTGAQAVRTSKDVIQAVVKDMQKQCDRGQDVAGVSTGFPHLDRKTSGLMPGSLVIIAGRPSMGKSLLALQIALHVALSGQGAHIATLEMSAEACTKRMLSNNSRVPFARVHNAYMAEAEDWPRLTDSSKLIAEAPLTIDDQAFACDAICARIRQQAMSRGLAVAMIDYLGYMQLPQGERQDLRVQEATRSLKRLAKELAIPVVLVAQLNRAVDSRANRRPVLSDLRDSGAIEQDADLVLLLHREDYYTPNTHLAGFAELIIAKQRDGWTGTLPLHHRFDLMRFDEAEGLPDEPEKQERGFASRYGKPRGDSDRKAASAA